MGQTLRRAGVMLALGWSGVACGGEENATTGGEKQEKAVPAISFQVTGDPEETRVYKELAQSYAQETGRTVNVVEVPERDVHLAKLTTSFSAGKAPDVFLLNYRYLGGFASKQVIEPAGPRLDESEVFDREAFYPLPMKAFEYDGALQCVPQNASSLAVYYNKDAFTKAGIDAAGGLVDL